MEDLEDKMEKDFLEKNFYWANRETLKKQNPSIVNFSFIRNLFEKGLFYKNFSHNRKSSEIEINQNLENLKNILEFVSERYANKSLIEELFNWYDEKLSKEFEELLENTNRTAKENIKLLLIRVFRLRNNYFHWEKDIEKEENNLFLHANHFMIMCVQENEHN